MSVASPPRPAPARPAGGKLVEDRPLRYPDTASREVMTRRGWWLVLLNFLLPGSAQAVAGNRRLGKVGLTATLVMWVLVILGGLSAMLWQQVFLTIITNWFALLLIQGVLLAYAALWVVLTIDTLRLVRLVRDRHGSAVRHPRPRPRAPAGLDRRSRVRLAAGRRDA